MREKKQTVYILTTGEVRAVFDDKLACSSASFILYERRSQEREVSCVCMESTPKSHRQA